MQHLFLLAASKNGEQRRDDFTSNCALVGNPVKSMSPLNVVGYGGAKRLQRS